MQGCLAKVPRTHGITLPYTMNYTPSLGKKIGGGSIDIYECFDQINRNLLKKLATIAGMPTNICRTLTALTVLVVEMQQELKVMPMPIRPLTPIS